MNERTVVGRDGNKPREACILPITSLLQSIYCTVYCTPEEKVAGEVSPGNERSPRNTEIETPINLHSPPSKMCRMNRKIIDEDSKCHRLIFYSPPIYRSPPYSACGLHLLVDIGEHSFWCPGQDFQTVSH